MPMPPSRVDRAAAGTPMDLVNVITDPSAAGFQLLIPILLLKRKLNLLSKAISGILIRRDVVYERAEELTS